MKRFIYILLFIFLFIPNSFAHEDIIIDENNKKSLKINMCMDIYYGYHAQEDIYHFHQVEWDELTEKWIIVNPDLIYDRNPCSEEIGLKENVEFYSCVDGDTVKLVLNKEIITVRMLAIDTPELTSANKDLKKLANEAKDYVCESLEKAKNIYLEYDLKSNKFDKYNRHLAWIFIDQELLQELLVAKGHAKVAYLYGRYKYVPDLQIKEEVAASNKIGIWKHIETNNDQENIKELTEEEKTEKLIYVVLVIVLTGIAILKEITKK